MSEVNRQGSRIVIDLDKEEDAIGLHAVLTGNQAAVSKDAFDRGQWLYGWFFTAIQKLATNYGQESSMVTMSAETATSMPVVAKRGKKR